MKFNKKIFSISLISVLSLAVVGSVTFGVTYYFVNLNRREINYVELAEKESFIRERTFSMKFTTIPYLDPEKGNVIINTLFGTSWIFDKVLNKEIYYLATNIHVVSDAISLQTGQTNKYEMSNYIDSIQLGYPKNPSVVSSVNDLSLETISNKSNFPQISYTSSFIENTSTYPIPSVISPLINSYTYAMTDLAILKFDFSSASQDFKVFLKYYNSRPTKFDVTKFNKNNYRQKNYFIGGYPFLENINTKIGTWGFDSSYNEAVAMLSGTVVSNIPQSDPKRGVLLPNDITNPSSNSTSRYFQNISNQITISNVTLTGGSSGSMVINDNLEVVGIYWGSYSSSGSPTILGAFDIFNTDAYATIFPSQTPGAQYKAYNRVEEINSIIRSTPLP